MNRIVVAGSVALALACGVALMLWARNDPELPPQDPEARETRGHAVDSQAIGTPVGAPDPNRSAASSEAKPVDEIPAGAIPPEDPAIRAEPTSVSEAAARKLASTLGQWTFSKIRILGPMTPDQHAALEEAIKAYQPEISGASSAFWERLGEIHDARKATGQFQTFRKGERIPEALPNEFVKQTTKWDAAMKEDVTLVSRIHLSEDEELARRHLRYRSSQRGLLDVVKQTLGDSVSVVSRQ